VIGWNFPLTISLIDVKREKERNTAHPNKHELVGGAEGEPKAAQFIQQYTQRPHVCLDPISEMYH
jgi:hypothetical protein